MTSERKTNDKLEENTVLQILNINLYILKKKKANSHSTLRTPANITPHDNTTLDDRQEKKKKKKKSTLTTK